MGRRQAADIVSGISTLAQAFGAPGLGALALGCSPGPSPGVLTSTGSASGGLLQVTLEQWQIGIDWPSAQTHGLLSWL